MFDIVVVAIVEVEVLSGPLRKRTMGFGRLTLTFIFRPSVTVPLLYAVVFCREYARQCLTIGAFKVEVLRN